MADPDAAPSAEMGTSRRVLSIQSHVVHGHVGNKSAVFPLQLLGFEVDPINSVQFSNHTGYPSWRGEVLQGDQLGALVEGLRANSLLRGYSHVLTGYIGSASFLRTVLDTVRAIRAENPQLIYFCDPVMGDNGKLYVPEELVQIYRDEVLPLASVLTPNQYEAEQLTETTIRSEADAVAACEALHARGPHTVVITSLELVGSEADCVTMLASRRTDDGALRQWRLRLPRVAQMFTGSGDLIAALLLAWSAAHPSPAQLPLVLEKAGASIQAVLRRTHASGRKELCLVQSREELQLPQVQERAEALGKAR